MEPVYCEALLRGLLGEAWPAFCHVLAKIWTNLSRIITEGMIITQSGAIWRVNDMLRRVCQQPSLSNQDGTRFHYCSAQWPSLTSQLRGKDEHLLRQWAADLREIKFWCEILSEKLPAVSPDFQTVAAFLEDLNTVIVSVLALGSGEAPAAGEQSQWIDNVHPGLAFRLQGRPHYL